MSKSMWTSAPIIFLLPLYFNGSRGLFTSSHLYNKGCWPETGILHNKLSISSKPGNSIIFWTILCVLLHQRSICHDLFTRKNSRRLNNCDTHCTCIGIIEHGPVCYLFMKKLVFFYENFFNHNRQEVIQLVLFAHYLLHQPKIQLHRTY